MKPLSTADRDPETLLIAHDLAVGLLQDPDLLRDASAPLPDGGTIDYQARLLARGARVGLLLADVPGAGRSVANNIEAVMSHAFRTRLAGLRPDEVDLVLHLGGRDFGLASLRRGETHEAQPLTVHPHRWHHFHVTELATTHKETVND